MNSDPFDSAAWRTFGMLDADESAIFDEAMRHDPVLRSAHLEMERLTAAIAAAIVTPIQPQAGQLERLQARLRLNSSKRTHFWLGITGWAAAAVLAVALILDHTGIVAKAASGSVANSVAPAVPVETTRAPATTVPSNQSAPAIPTVPDTTHKDAAIASASAAGKDKEGKTARVETKRLVQEIEVLRENLEKFQQRDRVLFEPVPGMALPIVMIMNPPGMPAENSTALARNDEHSPITAMLSDAMKAMTATSTGAQVADSALALKGEATLPAAHPTAIPIYDAARRSGTLFVNNLPPANEGEEYHLWVTMDTGEHPVYVGSLPESSVSGADSFDFSLGSTAVLPSGFILTRDPHDAPASPSEANTILQGPPAPSGE